jgi:hypothetical protein
VAGGYSNLASNDYATVSGGSGSTAAGRFSTVGGGAANSASGYSSVVAGGGTYTFIGPFGNTASGDYTAVGGGVLNRATTNFATVSGGGVNTASGFGAVVAGGGGVDDSFNSYQNAASGSWSVVGGGANNSATNDYNTVGGGLGNNAGGFQIFDFFSAFCVTGWITNVIMGQVIIIPLIGPCSTLITNFSSGATVGGGLLNQAGGFASTVGGGQSNVASGFTATVAGGYLNTASGDESFAAGSRATASHSGSFVWSDGLQDFGSTANYQFSVRADGGVRWDESTSQFFGQQTRQMLNLWGTQYGIGVQADTLYFRTHTGVAWYRDGVHNDNQNDPGGGAILMKLDASGNLCANSFGPCSDRNVKKDFAPVNPTEILDRVASLSIQTWHFTNETAAARHIGPMAQDFYAAFNVGADDKHIATVDADGVALAAIQGLHEMVKEKAAQISALEKRLAEVEQQATERESRLVRLEAAMADVASGRQQASIRTKGAR